MSQVKSVCTASLEEGHKHGVVRTPQEEGEALGREEVSLNHLQSRIGSNIPN